jgi:hypothetical protein
MSNNLFKNDSIKSCHIAVAQWTKGDGIAKMIRYELEAMGYEPVVFSFDQCVPEGTEILLTFAPWNKILPLWQRSQESSSHPPVVIHWNTEGMPDIRIHPKIMRILGTLRSKIGRMGDSNQSFDRFLNTLNPVKRMDRMFHRYRYLGDYEYAYRKGWLHVLADSSNIYCQIRNKLGVPTVYAPWGASKFWYEDLGLERDIDVIWMGKRGSQRRGRILDQVCGELEANGLKIHIADNEVNPFLDQDVRTDYLNRSKITLNITRTWYDDNFSRFSMAVPNRSLVVSEDLLPHCVEFKKGIHYVSSNVKDLTKTILYYLEHEEERKQITEDAYKMITTRLQFRTSLLKMLNAAVEYQNSPVLRNQF